VNVIFDPLAKREYEDAFEYYQAEKDGLGERFRGAVLAATTILDRFPEIGEEVRPGIRKILVQRFPYKRIDSIVDGAVYVIALAHGRREPEYWLGRT